jgi:hypothetical protein
MINQTTPTQRIIRLPETINQTKKNNIPELIAIGKTTFLQGVTPFGGSFGLVSRDEQW